MLSAFEMVFSPARAWEKVVAANRHWTLILLIVVLPVLALTVVVEGAGLLKFRERHAHIGMVDIPLERVVKYEVVYAGTALAIILIGAYFLQSVATSFNVPAGYNPSFAVIAYAYVPIMLMHVMDAIPQFNTWICWGIGVALSFGVLYHGVGLRLQPEQTKGFGLLLFSVIFITALSGLAHFASVQVLKGRLWRGNLDVSWLVP